MKPEIKIVGQKLHEEKFPTANCLLVAGSVVRGEGTPFSDLDVIVLFESVDNGYRDSFIFMDWPVEVFIHDLSTMKYFFKDDAKDGVPSLQTMISQGLPFPHLTDLARKAKDLAKESFDQGPPELTEKNIRDYRYTITDLIDDLREPKSVSEARATGTRLYGRLADFYLRAKREWSGRGKHIPRRMKEVNAPFAKKYEQAFEQLFISGDARNLIDLVEEILKPFGGLLFEGYKLEAPSEWRIL